MKIIISEDYGTVMVFEGETEEQFTMEEFIDAYGEDALPSKPEKIPNVALEAYEDKAIQAHNLAFMEFLDAVGKYVHFKKLTENAEDGVYPAQEVAYRYGYTNRFEQELYDRDQKRWRKLEQLSLASQQAGFLPLNEDGKRKVMAFFEDGDRRRYARDNLRRLAKQEETLSVADLMRKRYAVERTRKGTA